MSCFGGRDELLYLSEFTIYNFTLGPEKIKDIADCSLMVKLKFLSFPVFEISRTDVAVRPSCAQDGVIEFSCGKSCLFMKKPRDLVAAMKVSPIKIGIFCSGETFPIAETTIPLSGCLCDQVAMAHNDKKHMPKPYNVKGCFNLIDPGKNPAGIVNVHIRLTCLGTMITTQYQICPKNFVFKNEFDEGEFCVTRVEEGEKSDMMAGDNVVLGMIRDNGTTDKKKNIKKE